MIVGLKSCHVAIDVIVCISFEAHGDMDPLSISASVIAVLQISGKVISATYNYSIGVKEGAKNASRIRTAVKDLQVVLESLLELLLTESIDASGRLTTLAKLNEDDGSMQNCRVILERLESELQPQTGWRAARDALTWPLREEVVQKYLRTIEDIKSTLNLALGLDQMYEKIAVI